MQQDNRDYWEPKLVRNAERDRMALLELRRLGIRPLRFWDHELSVKSIDTSMRRVKRASGRPRLQRRSATR
jgi:G:T-mismatch repair DNA endonuclease (very short patch repair protein)